MTPLWGRKGNDKGDGKNAEKQPYSGPLPVTTNPQVYEALQMNPQIMAAYGDGRLDTLQINKAGPTEKRPIWAIGDVYVITDPAIDAKVCLAGQPGRDEKFKLAF